MESDSDIEILSASGPSHVLAMDSDVGAGVSDPASKEVKDDSASGAEAVIGFDPASEEGTVKKKGNRLNDDAVSGEGDKATSSKVHADLYKQLSKFHREVSASKKSKCEQNLLCLVDADVLELSGDLKKQLSEIFKSRRIGDQVRFMDTTGMKVLWKKRILEAEIQDNKLIRKEQWVYDNQCAFIIAAETFALMSDGRLLPEFFELLADKVPFPAPRITLAIYGIQRLQKSMANVALEAYVRNSAQVRFLNSPEELSRFIAQMHRSIAHKESRAEKQNKIVVDGEKGIKEGGDLVVDWWMKMLKHVHRIGDDQCRAIVKEFPDPIALSETLQAIGAKDGIKLMSEVVTDTGERVGPVIAQKIFLMLTATTGREVMDSST